MQLAQLRGKLIYAVVVGVVVMLGISLLSDLQEVSASFASFAWVELPLILGLTLLNYALRWLKWDYYLRQLNMRHGLSWLDSVLLFTCGMVMAVTPGKVGEVIKSYYLKRMNGTANSASAPIVLGERITDGLAMLLLMGFGLTLYEPARPAFVALVLLSSAGIAVLQFRKLSLSLIDRVAKVPIGGKVAPRLVEAYNSTQRLLQWRLLSVATLISVVSWFCECLAFYFVLRGLGEPDSWMLLQIATFVFAASTLFGLVSFLPGGLGVSEASSAALLILLVPMAAGPATTATLIIRFCTLWFGVTLGAIALGVLERRLRGRSALVVDNEELTQTAVPTP
jgi:uncharacterized protein (TIRG00374 family)